MSLMQRVEAAGCASAGKPAETQSRIADMRRRLSAILPSDEIAAIMLQNPRRAENEVRSACRRIFDDDPWFVQDEGQREALTDALLDSVFGLGPLEAMLADADITEIMVNGSRSLYVEREGKLYRRPAVFSSDEQVRALIDRIIGPVGRRIDESCPAVDARLPQGHRVHAIIPPIALDGPILTIRKFREHVISLEEMEETGSLDATMRDFLTWAVRAKLNLAVSGGTGSGKTTLLNALSCKIDHRERIVTIEDSAELRFHEHPHVVRLEARPENAEGVGEVSIRRLVINSLRMRPDRIVVGECRGAEALEMLQCMNTGHDGSLTTLHANSPSDAVLRLSTMVRYACDLPVDVIEAQIGSALDCIVQTERARDGRRFISELAEVSYDHDRGRLRLTTVYAWDYAENKGRWRSRPSCLGVLTLKGACSEEEVRRWLEATCLP